MQNQQVIAEMNATETVEFRLKTFKASSAFTPGDPLSFNVVLNEDYGLPGKYDAGDYIRSLGAAAAVADKNVLVVCPGNGGLCVEALKAGASTVVALEPRVVYDQALSRISDFTSEVIGTTFSRRAMGAKVVEHFDVIIWPEGLDEIVHPRALFEEVLDSLAPGGHLYIEVAHGTHKPLPESTNSWRPTKEAFKETLNRYPSVSVVSELAGRDQVRTIYTLQFNGTRVDPDAPRHVHIDMAKDAPDTSKENVQEFAERLQEEVKKIRQETADKAAPFVSKEFVQKEILKLSDEEIEEVKRMDEEREAKAAKKIAEKIKGMMPTEKKVDDNLDSIYEGRESTPKSNKKKRRGKGKGKSGK